MLYLVDERGHLDALAKQVFGCTNIFGRNWVVAQWLLILHQTSCMYSNLPVGDINRAAMEEVFKELWTVIANELVGIDDPESVLYERHLGSDVVHNQHEEVDDTVTAHERQEVAANVGYTDPCIRYTYITNQEQAYLGQNEDDFFRFLPQKNLLRVLGQQRLMITLTSPKVGKAGLSLMKMQLQPVFLMYLCWPRRTTSLLLI